MAKKKTRARRGARGLAAASVQALQSELNRRLETLQSQREALQAELDEVEEAIAEFEGAAEAPARRRPGRPAKKKKTTRRRPRATKKKKAARRKVTRKKKRGGRVAGKTTKKKKRTTRRGRPRNETSLVGALQKLLTNKTMSVTEMAEAVQKAGYQTSSPNFRTIVNQTLINNPSLFKRIARGQYTAK